MLKGNVPGLFGILTKGGCSYAQNHLMMNHRREITLHSLCLTRKCPSFSSGKIRALSAREASLQEGNLLETPGHRRRACLLTFTRKGNTSHEGGKGILLKATLLRKTKSIPEEKAKTRPISRASTTRLGKEST